MNERTKLAAVLVAALVGLTGCAATVEPIQTPGGQLGHVIDCTNSAGWQGCYEKAAEVCAGTYAVLAQNSGVEGVSGK